MKFGIMDRLRDAREIGRWMVAIGRGLAEVAPDDAPTDHRQALEAARAHGVELAAKLEASEGRRLELEKMLTGPVGSDIERWRQLLERWDTRVKSLGSAPYIEPMVPGEVARLVWFCGQLVDRAAMLHNALNRDRTGLAAALVAVQRIAEGYWWVTEGRGNHGWDEDGYRSETGAALSAIVGTARAALSLSGDRATAAIRDGRVLDETAVPLNVVVAGLLIDETRLRAVLEEAWDEVRGVGRFGPTGDDKEPLFTLVPRFEHLEPEQMQAFLRAAAVALRGAHRLAGPRKVRPETPQAVPAAEGAS